MTLPLDLRRRFFAEEIEAVAKLRSPRLVDAFAAVPRERFLPPGPWTLLSDSAESYMIASGIRLRPTPDADPARVYHNIAVAIDPERHLFNGQPATLGVWIDTLELAPASRVLHIGAGLGYYTAVMAECVGAGGRGACRQDPRGGRATSLDTAVEAINRTRRSTLQCDKSAARSRPGGCRQCRNR